MKYFQCNNPNIKALVALQAIKGESIPYLSAKYHVNPEDIARWRRQLLKEMYVEKWMVAIFTKKPFFEKEKREDPEPF
jgi:hypothetical protein